MAYKHDLQPDIDGATGQSKFSNPAPYRLLSAAEQATLLDIVRQYHSGTATPQNAIAWVYGLVANSALNDGSL